MARGRPSGSKNKSGHSAGRDRRSRKYNKRLEDEKGEQQQRRTDDFFKQRNKAVEPPKGKNVSTLGIIDSTSDNWDVS